MRIRALVLPLLAYGLSAPIAHAQGRGVLLVQVRADGGTAVPRARVSVAGLATTPLTGASGTVRMALPPGLVRGQVAAVGYAPLDFSATVAAGRTDTLRLTLRPTVLSLGAITVTAAPGARGVGDVAAPVTVLSRRDLDRVVGGTLAATLSQQPGMSMRSQGPAAAMPVVRGLTGDRIVVLQDGQRAADLAASAPDHGVTIDPLAAHGVEIVRGPAALLYGSNAIGGVVNVVSEDIPRVVPSRRLTEVTVTGATVTPGAATAVDVTQPLGAHVAVSLRGGARSQDDQRLAVGGAQANTSARNTRWVAGLGIVRDSADGGLAFRGYDFEYGLPFRDTPASAVRLRGARREATLRGRLAGSGMVREWQVDGTVQRYSHDEVLAGGEVATTLGVDTKQVQLLARTGPSRRLTGGAFGVTLLTRDHGVVGAAALTPPNASTQLGVVAFQELALPGAVRLPLAVRMERTGIATRSTETFGPRVEREFRTWSASAGLVVPTGRGASIGVNVVDASRVPGPEELFSRAGHAGTGAFETGNPRLAVEATRGIDLGWRLERSGVRVHLAAWHSAVRGWIGMYATGRDTTVATGALVKTLPLFEVSQRDARLSGLEASVERVVREHLVLGGTADVVRARDVGGTPLPFMPAAHVGAQARWDGRRLQLGATVRRQARQGEVPGGEWRTDGFTRVDAFAGVRWTVGSTVHAVTARLDNAANAHTRDATSRAKDYAPNAGRNLLLAWRLTF